tara:strand:+ start:1668 stop:1979 length:312 start_codon:yes stop_codon:yes gene_type:complete
MTNTKISLIERIKRWKKSNIVFIMLLILLIYQVNVKDPSYEIGASIVLIVILTIPYAIMMIIIDIVTSKSSEVIDKRASIKKEQKEAEKKEEKQKVEDIDLDL